MKKLTFFILSCILISCAKEESTIRISKGKASIRVNTYFDAYKKKDFENQFSFTSVINFKDGIAIEEIQDLNELFYIKKDSFAELKNKNFVENKSQFMALDEKPIGLGFKEIIFDEKDLVQSKDTIIENEKHIIKSYKNDDEIRRVLMKKTDTLYEFSFGKSLENSFNGRIQNIQIYNRKEDIFMTIYISYSKDMEKEKEDIINFNQYLKANGKI